MNSQENIANFSNLISHEWQSKEIKVKFQFEEGCFSYKINEREKEVFCAELYVFETKEKFLVIRRYIDPMNILVRIEYKSPTSIIFGLYGKSIELEVCDCN